MPPQYSCITAGDGCYLGRLLARGFAAAVKCLQWVQTGQGRSFCSMHTLPSCSGGFEAIIWLQLPIPACAVVFFPSRLQVSTLTGLIRNHSGSDLGFFGCNRLNLSAFRRAEVWPHSRAPAAPSVAEPWLWPSIRCSSLYCRPTRAFNLVASLAP